MIWNFGTTHKVTCYTVLYSKAKTLGKYEQHGQNVENRVTAFSMLPSQTLLVILLDVIKNNFWLPLPF